MAHASCARGSRRPAGAPGWLAARVGWLCAWAFFILGGGAALAAEPTAEPLLRLETGMHTAVIKRIATDASGRWAVTASDDKTAQVWEVASGGQVAVLRPPQDTGDEGKLYAAAMSPDGVVVAVAGWTSADWNRQTSIYLFDRASARLLRRIQGLPNVVLHLGWSPHGRWLAASLWGSNGIRRRGFQSRDCPGGGDATSRHQHQHAARAGGGGDELPRQRPQAQVRRSRRARGRQPPGAARPRQVRRLRGGPHADRRRGDLANIEKTLHEMAGRARPDDTFVLFLAGHGTMLDNQYYSLPYELDYENDASIRKAAVSQDRLRDWLRPLPQRSLLLLDTCRAGNAVQLASRAGAEKGAFSTLIRLSGRAVVVASSNDDMALEGYQGHGVFSWVVLDALDHADYDENGTVDVSDIAMHVRRNVPVITDRVFNYRQVPMQDVPGEPFAIAVPLPKAKQPAR